MRSAARQQGLMGELIQLARDYPVGLALLVAAGSVYALLQVVKKRKANGNGDGSTPYEDSFVQRMNERAKDVHDMRGEMAKISAQVYLLGRRLGYRWDKDGVDWVRRAKEED